MKSKEIIVRKMAFPHGEKNVIIIKERINYITSCATEYNVLFYTMNNEGQGFVGVHKYTVKIGIDGGIFDESWKITKQISHEIYNEFLALADKLLR